MSVDKIYNELIEFKKWCKLKDLDPIFKFNGNQELKEIIVLEITFYINSHNFDYAVSEIKKEYYKIKE